MKIMEFINTKAVAADLKATTKEGVIKELSGLLAKAGAIKEDKTLVRTLLDREALGSTGIGQGVGIPHGKCSIVKELVAAFGISKRGVDFNALDGEPVYIFFLLLAPEDSAGPHLKALARISRLLKDKYVRNDLIKAESEQEILKILKEEDEKRH
jgi:PTS system nitrogen regulatory IIA component